MSRWQDEEYYVYPVLPGTDYREHTEEHPFCEDFGDEQEGRPGCPCHEDEANLQQLQQWYDEGLIGATDGELIYRGRTI